MASKLSFQLAPFLRPLYNTREVSRAFSGLATIARRNDLSVTPKTSMSTPLLGVSLQSLPGNRWPATTTSLIITRAKRVSVADSRISWNVGAVGIEEVDDYSPLSDEQLQQAVAHQINDTLEQGKAGRLYAIVHVRAIQHKVTAGDIIVVKHDFPPTVGDKIRLEKVLAVGGSDFTLFGRPILSRNQVLVEATVVEKTMSHNRVRYLYRKRKNWKKMTIWKEFHTMLVINSICVARLGDQNQIEDS